ncbi:MAG: formate dehydrogenase accessory sulfurtransferase FdhD [Candidatus Binataceae bacterium]
MTSISHHPVIRYRIAPHGRENLSAPDTDSLAVEEPLEIRLGGHRFTVTMRTPGHDEDLVAGFLLSEGFVSVIGEISEIRRVMDRQGRPELNIVDVILNVPADSLRKRLRRNFAISSSCGLCGRTTIESIRSRITPITGTIVLPATLLMSFAPRMRKSQEIFASTGGLHAAALFLRGQDGDARESNAGADVVREDIGRHNAVDKAIGHAMRAGMTPLARAVMMVSGRLSFEIVQKTAVAGVPILAGVSAPSSLAIELADETGITLIGFMREGGFNLYSHAERIAIA